ncbi:UNVERIFIED_CONTAM: hypothetical protein Sradi_6880000 [Sesamum radiatum]|uniref:DUF4283 domain-containing protein n=1 Tax=Sesamum radiatum TaxID=300843 RepID=A0AAW2JKU1_SESRA
MEENSLLPLSHSTHTSHTHITPLSCNNQDTHATSSAPAGDAAAGVEDESRQNRRTLSRRQSGKNSLLDFFSLATRVLKGDDASMDKLESLKQQWDRKFPDPEIAKRLFYRGSRPSLDSDLSQSCSQGVFVGNVKIHMPSSDSIANAFLNSTRKTLRFIQPTTQRDEVIIKPTPAMVEQGSKRWHATAVGYFLGKKPYFPQLEAFAKANWKGLLRVSATANGFYFFQFQTTAFMEEIIEEGPWLFQGQPIVLQAWEQGMSLRRQKHVQIPVWIRLRHLPMEYWTVEGLSAVASGVGTPLYADKITHSCSD